MHKIRPRPTGADNGAALLWKETRVKGHGSGKMLSEVSGVVAARVNVEFMRDAARGEDLVESGGAGIKAEIVLVSAIEINLQACKICCAGHDNGAVLFPEGRIGRIAEDAPEHA